MQAERRSSWPAADGVRSTDSANASTGRVSIASCRTCDGLWSPSAYRFSGNGHGDPASTTHRNGSLTSVADSPSGRQSLATTVRDRAEFVALLQSSIPQSCLAASLAPSRQRPARRVWYLCAPGPTRLVLTINRNGVHHRLESELTVNRYMYAAAG